MHDDAYEIVLMGARQFWVVMELVALSFQVPSLARVLEHVHLERELDWGFNFRGSCVVSPVLVLKPLSPTQPMSAPSGDIGLEPAVWLTKDTSVDLP